MSLKKNWYLAGFTLLEMLLSVAIIAAITVFSFPAIGLLQSGGDLDSAFYTTLSALRQAQTYSQGIKNDSSWGIRFDAGNIVIFKGANFLDRDVAQDQILLLPESIIPSGLNEIVFSKLLGQPQNAGVISFTALNGETKNINLNAFGAMDY